MDPDYDYCYENEDGDLICRCFEFPFFNDGGTGIED